MGGQAEFGKAGIASCIDKNIRLREIIVRLDKHENTV